VTNGINKQIMEFDIRRVFRLTWDSRLKEQKIPVSYGEDLRRTLQNPPKALLVALQQSGGSGNQDGSGDGGDEDFVVQQKGNSGAQDGKVTATTRELILTEELYDNLRVLTEKGDFYPSQCQKP
jgi:hypothetical protein